MGFSFGNPLKKITENITGALEDNPGLSYGGETTPNIPIPNIDVPGGSFEDVGGGVSLLTSNVGYVAKGIIGEKDGGGIIGNVDRLAKAYKEAMTGKGGYADDEAGAPPGPGPTGFEAANASSTMLTGQRKKGAGRSAHAYAGSASNIG